MNHLEPVQTLDVILSHSKAFYCIFKQSLNTDLARQKSISTMDFFLSAVEIDSILNPIDSKLQK